MTIYHSCDRPGDRYEDAGLVNLDGMDDAAEYESWLVQDLTDWAIEYEEKIAAQSGTNDLIPFPELLEAAHQIQQDNSEN
jgi:hypothetical protein